MVTTKDIKKIMIEILDTIFGNVESIYKK
jgi:hypothetical protein